MARFTTTTLMARELMGFASLFDARGLLLMTLFNEAADTSDYLIMSARQNHYIELDNLDMIK
jgi:hypothetical protein